MSPIWREEAGEDQQLHPLVGGLRLGEERVQRRPVGRGGLQRLDVRPVDLQRHAADVRVVERRKAERLVALVDQHRDQAARHRPGLALDRRREPGRRDRAQRTGRAGRTRRLALRRAAGRHRGRVHPRQRPPRAGRLAAAADDRIDAIPDQPGPRPAALVEPGVPARGPNLGAGAPRRSQRRWRGHGAGERGGERKDECGSHEGASPLNSVEPRRGPANHQFMG
jgi:hypothetical protein